MTIHRDLLPAEYVTLGFLAIQPAHGYDVARRWAASPVASVLSADQAMVYGYLRTLEREQLVDWTETRVGRRPPRRVYTVNEDGWSPLRAWLRQPVQRMREARLDLLLKLFFLESIDPDAIPGLIRDQVGVCERYVADARARLAAAEGFERLVRESKLSAGEATLAWLAPLAPPAPRRRAS